MEKVIKVHIEKLPEGLYLSTSDDIQGLVAQGLTVSETLDIARDVTRKLLEAQSVKKSVTKLKSVKKSFNFELVVSV